MLLRAQCYAMWKHITSQTLVPIAVPVNEKHAYKASKAYQYTVKSTIFSGNSDAEHLNTRWLLGLEKASWLSYKYHCTERTFNGDSR